MLELFKKIRKEWAGKVEIRDAEDGYYDVYLITDINNPDSDIIRSFRKTDLFEIGID